MYDWKVTIRVNITILKCVGLWPKQNEAYQYNLYTLYAIVSLNLFINAHNFFQTANIFFVYNDLEALAAMLFVVFTDLLTSVKLCYFVSNMRTLKQLMSTLDEEKFQPRSLDQRVLVRKGLSQWKFTYVAFWVPVATTLVLWAVFPVLDGSFKHYRLPFSAWYPYNTKTSPYYEITYVYQVVSIWFLATANLNMDTLIAALMMYIGTQCDILCDNIKHFNDYKQVIDCIEHHKMILSFAKNCNKFFHKIALGQFFTSSVSLGIAMFQLTLVSPTSSECFSLLFYVGSITVQIFLYCWFGNEVEVKVHLDGNSLGLTFGLTDQLTNNEILCFSATYNF